jgi:N-glycosylase/DNA lyase
MPPKKENLCLDLNELQCIYDSIRQRVALRLREFKKIWQVSSDDDIFVELLFCILTPQSKATVCWSAAQRVRSSGLIYTNDRMKLANTIHPVRFKYNKAEYIITSRTRMLKDKKICIKERIAEFKDVLELREWLVGNVKGMGYKEASHFLRNIGFGQDIAILDRHILKNLKIFGVIPEIPKTISRKAYFEIEDKMKEFAEKVNIRLDHLDFVLWFKEARDVFK